MKGAAQAREINHQEEETLEVGYLAPEAEVEEEEKLDATLVARQNTCIGTVLKINQQIRGMKMSQTPMNKQLI
jgi:hypothetical protein